MPKHFEPSYLPLDGITVRIPAFPVEMYRDLTDNERRLQWTRNPQVRLALATASLSLLNEQDRSHQRAKEHAHRDYKTLNYLIRMSTRPTPFGMLSGILVANWGESTSITVTPNERHTRTRPDMQWLMSIVHLLEDDQEVRQQLRFTTNSAIIVFNGRINLPEKALINQTPPFPSVSIRATRIALLALELAREPISYHNLAAALLKASPTATPEKVSALIDTLCEQTFLLSELRPALTTPCPPAYIRERLAKIKGIDIINDYLIDVFTACETWDEEVEDQNEERYLALISLARRTSSVLESYREHVFSHQQEIGNIVPVLSVNRNRESWYQVDLAWMAEAAHITSQIKIELARAIEVMARISIRPRGLPFLETYRQRFIEHYGRDRKVPLLEAIDSNRGIGLPTPYLQQSDQQGSITFPFDDREHTLLSIATQVLRTREKIVYLDEPLIQTLQKSTLVLERLPPSIDYFCSIAAPSRDDIDNGDYLIVTSPLGISMPARSNLGRFADVIGSSAVELMRETMTQEMRDNPNAIWAECTYLPLNTRSSNIAIVPQIRPYEIQYGVTMATDAAVAIPLNELVLGIYNDRLILYWSRTSQQVIVQFSHLLNHQYAPGLLRFLHDLNYDNICLPTPFTWGLAEALPYLPRIQYNRVVLRCAQWNLTDPLFHRTLDTSTTSAFAETFEKVSKTWNIPRFVYILERDNRLLLDLHDSTQIELLRIELGSEKKQSSLKLIEALPGPNDAWIVGKDGHYLSECVVSFLRRDLKNFSDKPEPKSTRMHFHQPFTTDERLYPPGSEWLFMKLYIGQEYQQEVLGQYVYQIVQDLLSRGLTDKWFFIRYNDPEPHIRLRFHGDANMLIQNVLPTLCIWGNALLTRDICAKYMFDSYDREIERYGGREAISIAEHIFFADSTAAIQLLALKEQGKIAIDLTDLVILTMDDLLNSLETDWEQRRQWYRAYGASHPESGKYYREHSRKLRPLLYNSMLLNEQITGGDLVTQILEQRRFRLHSVSPQWTSLEQADQLICSRASLYASLTHMHCNRLLGTDRKREDLIRTMLDRLYEGLRRKIPSSESDDLSSV